MTERQPAEIVLWGSRKKKKGGSETKRMPTGTSRVKTGLWALHKVQAEWVSAVSSLSQGEVRDRERGREREKLSEEEKKNQGNQNWKRRE